MAPSYEQLVARVEKIKAIRNLQKELDPASGLAVAIRRGPLGSSDESSHWLSVEVCGSMQEIIDLLIIELMDNADFWARECIQAAIDASYEVDHPTGASYWAGMK